MKKNLQLFPLCHNGSRKPGPGQHLPGRHPGLPASGPLRGASFCKNEAEGFDKSLSSNPEGSDTGRTIRFFKPRRGQSWFGERVIDGRRGSAPAGAAATILKGVWGHQPPSFYPVSVIFMRNRSCYEPSGICECNPLQILIPPFCCVCQENAYGHFLPNLLTFLSLTS
jgi:hypothetical protein